MLGGEIPELATTPCLACGRLVDEGDVVWDAWHMDDHRFAAMPYHPACAKAILPPDEPSRAHRHCGICEEPLDDVVVLEAFKALHSRFDAAKGSVLTPVVAWRLAARDPERLYVPEHFACIMGKVTRTKKRPPQSPPEELPGLPGETQPAS